MAWLAEKAASAKRWEKILDDDSGAFATNGEFVQAAREVFDRHKGKPSQAVDVTSGGKSLTLTAEERAERLAQVVAILNAK